MRDAAGALRRMFANGQLTLGRLGAMGVKPPTPGAFGNSGTRYAAGHKLNRKFSRYRAFKHMWSI